MQIIGAILCTLVGLRVAQSIAAAYQEQARAATRGRLALDLLNEQVSAAKALRVRREQQQLHWNGYRKFRVRDKVVEAKDICSFYLVPHDEKPLPSFRPGQFLTFRMDLPAGGDDKGTRKPVVRCYSLSDAPPASHSRDHNYYRITVKRVPPPPDSRHPPGRVSNYLIDHVKVGDILDVQAPRGDFCLDPESAHPVVLIGGGVGITPVLSMAETILRVNPSRHVWLFYGIRCGPDHAMKDRLRQLDQAYENFHLHVCYSCPHEGDWEGTDYHTRGHVGVDVLKQVLKVNNFEYYICGPPAMMNTLVPALEEWGVPKDRVFMEAFGPATVKKTSTVATLPAAAAPGTASPSITVEFSRSGKSVQWNGTHASLLDLALENSIEIDSGCRAGSCGSCEVAVKSGSVDYTVDSRTECGAGSCLTCVSVPKGHIVLDA